MKIIALGLSCLLSTACFCQINNRYEKTNRKTLYNLNKKPCSCADNMENLFYNWVTENIANASYLQLISFTHLGTIQDNAEINDYADLMTQWDAPFANTGGRQEYGRLKIPQNDIYFSVFSYKKILNSLPQEQKEQAKEALANELEQIKMNIKNSIKIGDKIYSVRFKYLDETMTGYIFCDSETI